MIVKFAHSENFSRFAKFSLCVIAKLLILLLFFKTKIKQIINKNNKNNKILKIKIKTYIYIYIYINFF